MGHEGKGLQYMCLVIAHSFLDNGEFRFLFLYMGWDENPGLDILRTFHAQLRNS